MADRAANRILVISDSAEHASGLGLRLAEFFAADIHQPGELSNDTEPGAFTLVDVNLRDTAHVANLKRWLKRRPKHGQAIFGIRRNSRHEAIQAYAIGATDVVPRPIDARVVVQKFLRGRGPASPKPAKSCDISRYVGSLQNVFAAAVCGQLPDLEMLEAASADIVERIEEDGLARWLDVIRQHHSQTFQHCLIVTAVAVSFGRVLGFHVADRQRLASAGLLHDLGKARIPVEILEKPTPLSSDEIIRSSASRRCAMRRDSIPRCSTSSCTTTSISTAPATHTAL